MDLAQEGILGDFEGAPVKGVGVEIRNASGGLNDALEVDPVVLHGGDTVWVVLQCDVTAITHKPVKGDEGSWQRVHVMRATDVTLMDSNAVRKAITDQRTRIQKHREAKKGVQRMFDGEGEDEASSNGNGGGEGGGEGAPKE
jgi:hypothetical protein